MWAVIGAFSFVTSLVSLIVAIVAKARKNGYVKRSLFISAATFALFIVAIASTPAPPTKGAASSATASQPVDTATADAKSDREKQKEKEAALAKLKKQQEADIAAKKAKAKAEEKAKKAKAKAEEKAKKEKAMAEEKAKKEKAMAEEEAKKNDPAEIAKKSATKYFESAEIKFDSSSGFLEITAAGKDNLSTNMIKEGMWLSASYTLKDLKDVKAITDVAFTVTFPMVDKYGNESQSKVMTINFIADTRSKINWANFIFTNLPDIADTYWAHPAFSE